MTGPREPPMLTPNLHLERLVINPLISNGMIKFYCRYVDDRLLLIKHDDIEFLLNKFHSFDRNIRFTYDIFSDEPPHFLDLKLDGNKFSIYRNIHSQVNALILTVTYRGNIALHGFALFYVALPISVRPLN